VRRAGVLGIFEEPTALIVVHYKWEKGFEKISAWSGGRYCLYAANSRDCAIGGRSRAVLLSE
jgi:hypothetical protein